ncbi:rap guanine nucleotide exchange factor 6-like [Eudromia elegans]
MYLEEKRAVNDSAVFAGTGSPQKSLSLSEEGSTKKQTEDTLSMASSLHSSPPASPQGSPRKVGSIQRADNCSQMNLSGSSSSLASEASNKNSGQRSYGIGYALIPSTKSDNFSDSSHSEISSRSSIVSNCSVDSMSAALQDERGLSQSLGGVDSAGAERKEHPQPLADYAQPCPGWSLSRPALIRGMAFTSSMSSEEISHEHILVEAADSGRGSWTSCSSSSHDNFQNLPNQKSWDLLNSYRHTQLDGPIAEVDPTNCYSEEAYLYSEPFSKNNRQSKANLEGDQSRQSWASSSSLSDTYETNYGTIKRRGLETSAAEPTEVLDSKPGTDTAYKTVTSSTEKGLIVYCVTSPKKDDRYREPPPTPPGYLGISLADIKEGSPHHPHLKPPDYSVAVQRSKMLHEDEQVSAV